MENILKGKKIVLGITGSIAAYKTPLLVRELVKLGAEVKTILTPSAVNFVSPMILSNLSLNPVVIDMFDKSVMNQGAWHIHLAHWCDAMLIAPCSASTLGKINNGIADNALVAVTLALHSDAKLIISPAMDTNMLLHKATQKNIKELEESGAYIIPPAEGELASGLVGPGRMPELSVIIEHLQNALSSEDKTKTMQSSEIPIDFIKGRFSGKIEEIYKEKESKPSGKTETIVQEKKINPNDIMIDTLQDAAEKIQWKTDFDLDELKKKMGISGTADSFFKGKKVLINAGPTYEKIDDVRFIGNFSSGKMGYAIANTAFRLGADVTLISGPSAEKADEGINILNVVSAEEMYNAVMQEFDNSEIIILSAAVADFTPKEKFSGKIKKESAQDTFTIELVKTKDILAECGKRKDASKLLIGFALESSDEIENGFKKMQEKNCDMVIVNSANKPDSGFSGENNTITVLTKDGKFKAFPAMTKDLCSIEILKEISEIRK